MTSRAASESMAMHEIPTSFVLISVRDVILVKVVSNARIRARASGPFSATAMCVPLFENERAVIWRKLSLILTSRRCADDRLMMDR